MAIHAEPAAAVGEVTSQQPAAAQYPLYSHVTPLPPSRGSRLTFLRRAKGALFIALRVTMVKWGLATMELVGRLDPA